MKLRIFVIDDEQSITDTLSWHLSDKGHEVISVSTPTDCPVYAGEKCTHRHPCGDILIIDQQMQNMTGLEFVEHMMKKGCKGLVHNKVVMSGSLTQDVIAKAKALGCIPVSKPITLEMVDDLVEELSKNIPQNRKLSEILIAA